MPGSNKIPFYMAHSIALFSRLWLSWSALQLCSEVDFTRQDIWVLVADALKICFCDRTQGSPILSIELGTVLVKFHRSEVNVRRVRPNCAVLFIGSCSLPACFCETQRKLWAALFVVPVLSLVRLIQRCILRAQVLPLQR